MFCGLLPTLVFSSQVQYMPIIPLPLLPPLSRRKTCLHQHLLLPRCHCHLPPRRKTIRPRATTSLPPRPRPRRTLRIPTETRPLRRSRSRCPRPRRQRSPRNPTPPTDVVYGSLTLSPNDFLRSDLLTLTLWALMALRLPRIAPASTSAGRGGGGKTARRRRSRAEERRK